MNERIKELWEEANAFARENVEYSRTEGFEIFTDKLYEVSLEKFAELIVRECIKEIEFQYGGGSDQPMDNEWDRAIECVSSMVKYRFGVQE